MNDKSLSMEFEALLKQFTKSNESDTTSSDYAIMVHFSEHELLLAARIISTPIELEQSRLPPP